MKLSRVFMLAAAVVLVCGMSGAVAKADGVDPAIGVRGCVGTGCSIIVGPSEPFFTTTFFGGVTERDFGFINHTGQTAVELDLLARPLSNTPVLTYTCTFFEQYYNTCSQQDMGGGAVLIKYFNNTEGSLGGIPSDPCLDGCGAVPAADAQLVVTDAPGTHDFSSLHTDQGFTADVTLIGAVPEPTTIILLSTGLGCFGLFRRRRNQKAD